MRMRTSDQGKICMMNESKKRNRSSGFTLIEVIVAMVILSIITVIIGSSFHLGLNAWEKGEAEINEIQTFRILTGLISQQVKSAYPYKMKFENEDTVLFEGEPDSIFFVTASAGSSYGGFKWVRYRYKDNTLQYLEGILPDKKLLERTNDEWEILESDIGEVKFSFLSPEDGSWSESWDLGNGLPGAITVRIGYFEPALISLPMTVVDAEDIKENEYL